METERKIQVLEGVLAQVVNRALNTDGLPPAVVRLALADALHTVRELERQMEARRAEQAKEGTNHGKPAEAE